MLVWKDEYSVGVELIDNQHKHLFEIGNKIYALLKDDLSLDRYDKIVEIINELKQYTDFHFKTEEKYMLENKYKGYFTQKVQHDDFIIKINEINLEKVDNNQDKYIDKILRFVFEWILNHILTEDIKINR
jgi:hemerythrin